MLEEYSTGEHRQQFYDWSERARAEKDKCEQGLISQKELEVWLKESK